MSDEENEGSISCIPDEHDNNSSSDDDDDDDDISLADIMQTFFASSDGKNIVDVISKIKSSLDTNNKILHKISIALDKIASKS